MSNADVYNAAQRQRYLDIVDAVNELGVRWSKEPQKARDSMSNWAPSVLSIFRGVGPSMWIKVDDRIGNAHPDFREGGWMVRCVRNSPAWGPQLTDAVNK